MALTNNNLEIIKAIAKNDIHGARIAAMASLAEDTSKKNAGSYTASAECVKVVGGREKCSNYKC